MAARLDETDAVRLQNLQLRQALLQREADDFAARVAAKYQSPGEAIQVQPDGTITRTRKATP